LTARKGLKSQMECKDSGDLVEYIGCKLDRDVEGRTTNITQPVLLQSLTDEFELPAREYRVPDPAGKVLSPDNPMDELLYRSGVGKLLHLAKWSRSDILYSVRELSKSKFMTTPRQSCWKAMLQCMKYAVLTRKHGLVLKPSRKWDGKGQDL
jgi:hypothetical protein